jgi:hypothetical protein
MTVGCGCQLDKWIDGLRNFKLQTSNFKKAPITKLQDQCCGNLRAAAGHGIMVEDESEDEVDDSLRRLLRGIEKIDDDNDKGSDKVGTGKPLLLQHRHFLKPSRRAGRKRRVRISANAASTTMARRRNGSSSSQTKGNNIKARIASGQQTINSRQKPINSSRVIILSE